MRSSAAIACAVLAICAGCSESHTPKRTIAETAPTVAEAERAVRRHSQFNVETGPARYIDCYQRESATDCSVEYDRSCTVLSVTRRSGKLAVEPARTGICLHVTTDPAPLYLKP
jgi:hypothetical protein